MTIVNRKGFANFLFLSASIFSLNREKTKKGKMMKKVCKLFLLSVLCLLATGVFAQNSNIIKTNLSQAEIDRIVKTFTSKEGEFRQALGAYAFNRKAQIQTVGMGGQISGLYRRDSFLTFAEDGRRVEKILFAPISTLQEITITAEDLENLNGVDPYAIDPKSVALYNFSFVGKEKIDELDLYVFDASPKVMPDPKKTKQTLFSGRIWVDDQDLQIVKSKGKAVPETKQNKYAVIETWRENIEGKYWFPSLSTSDDELIFDNGNVVKLRIRVRYSNYTQGRTDVKVLDDDQEIKEETPKPKPTPTPKKP